MKGISKWNAFASKYNISAGVFSVYVITKVYTAKTASKQVYGGIMVSSKEDGSLPC